MNRLRVLSVVAIVLAGVVSVLYFQPAKAGDWRLGVMPTSKHWKERNSDDGGYNEKHKGIIVEKRIRNSWIGYMYARNSFDDPSHWAYILRPINSWKSNRMSLDLGYQLGAVTGYDISPAPFATITLELSFGRARARAATIPLIVTGAQYLWEFGQ